MGQAGFKARSGDVGNIAAAKTIRVGTCAGAPGRSSTDLPLAMRMSRRCHTAMTLHADFGVATDGYTDCLHAVVPEGCPTPAAPSSRSAASCFSILSMTCRTDGSIGIASPKR